MAINRPLSVTIVGWVLIVMAITSWPSLLRTSADQRVLEKMAARSSVPVAVQQAVSFTGAMLKLVCGYFLLRGKNWRGFWRSSCQSGYWPSVS